MLAEGIGTVDGKASLRLGTAQPVRRALQLGQRLFWVHIGESISSQTCRAGRPVRGRDILFRARAVCFGPGLG